MIISFIKDDLDKGKSLDPTLVLVAVVTLALAIFIAYTLSKSLQQIIISDNGIVVTSSIGDKQTLKWSELCEIETTGKRLWTNELHETIKFVPNSGARVIIPHDSLGNISELCQAIEHIKSQIEQGDSPSLAAFKYETEKEENKKSFDDRRAVRYGKKHIFSINGLFLLFCVGCAMKFISLFFKFYVTASFTYLFSVGLFVPLLLMVATTMAWQMFYFEVNDTHIVVRNPMLPLYQKTYPLAEILAVDSEHHYRQNRSLRIITNKYGSSLYHAGSLSGEEWREMFYFLRRHDVDTRTN